MKEKIKSILIDFASHQINIDEAAQRLLDLQSNSRNYTIEFTPTTSHAWESPVITHFKNW